VAIRHVAPLRDDAFQAEPTGVLEHGATGFVRPGVKR
jgi:hypothetical protein